MPSLCMSQQIGNLKLPQNYPTQDPFKGEFNPFERQSGRLSCKKKERMERKTKRFCRGITNRLNGARHSMLGQTSNLEI